MKVNRTAALLLATTILAASNPALAQEAAPASNEIVVTAQHRQERLEKVPISVTQVAPATLENFNIDDVANLQLMTPGLTATSWVGYGQFYIRGIGANFSNPGVENPVGIYVDGAYVVRGKGGNLEVMDVDNIQVLKGPQGTLWGRNATAGAILINTADPKHEFAAHVGLEAGNQDHQAYEGMINLPLGDKVALRVAASRRNEGGYITNLPDGYKFGWSQNSQLRAKLLFEPTSDFKAVLQFEKQWRKASQNANSQGLPNALCLDCNTTGYTFPLNDPYTTVINRIRPDGVGIDADNTFANLKMDWNLGGLKLSSVTSYTDNYTLDLCDCDLTSKVDLHFNIPSTNKTFTQSLVGTSGVGDNVDLTFGVDYLHDKSTYEIVGIVPKGFIKTESISPFAEVTFRPVEKLSITGGLRYTSDKRSGTQVGGAKASFSDDYLSPRLVLAYDLDSVNIYASFNKGFKAGGINSPQAGFGIYEKEALSAYEAGLKYYNRAADLRFNLASFYYDYKNLQTVAINQGGSGGPGSVQQPDAKLWGVEFDFQWHPIKELRLFGGGLWEHSEYRNYPNAGVQIVTYNNAGQPTGMTTGTESLTGHRLPHAPKFSANLGADLEVPVNSSGWTAQLTGVLSYSDSYDFFPGAGGPLRYDQTASFATTRLSGAFKAPDDKYEIGFFVDNVTNSKNTVFRFTTAPFGATNIIARPRTYGLRMSANF